MSATDDTITLAQAISWTSNWRATPASNVRAFLIPIEDLQGALSEIQNQSGSPMARAYLAIDNGVEKLIIVGTSQEQKGGVTIYRDLLPSNDGVGDAGNSIYDFTQPCPPDCDPSSPLN